MAAADVACVYHRIDHVRKLQVETRSKNSWFVLSELKTDSHLYCSLAMMRHELSLPCECVQAKKKITDMIQIETNIARTDSQGQLFF
jgi:hypothetical protein